jgi:hypothetical protein
MDADSWPMPVEPWRYGSDLTVLESRSVRLIRGVAITPGRTLWVVGTTTGQCVAWPDEQSAIDAYSNPWAWARTIAR